MRLIDCVEFYAVRIGNISTMYSNSDTNIESTCSFIVVKRRKMEKYAMIHYDISGFVFKGNTFRFSLFECLPIFKVLYKSTFKFYTMESHEEPLT